MIARLPKRVSSEKKQMGVERGKDNRLGPYHPEIFRLHRHRKNVLRLTSATIKPRQFASNNDVWIERIGNDITIFLGRNRLPIAERNFPLVPTAFYSNRTAFLLTTVKPIRERVVRADVIQLRSRLIVPRAPALSTVHCDDRALIRAQENDVGIIRI